jgi:hydroxyacylglutathione hydrolase
VEVKTVDGVESVAADRVINCTGPSLHYRHVGSALLESLLQQGLATPGAMDAGFRTSRDGAMIEEDGAVSQVLYNLGPGRLGTLLESIAVPEIREQAVALALLLKKRVGCRICRQAA